MTNIICEIHRGTILFTLCHLQCQKTIIDKGFFACLRSLIPCREGRIMIRSILGLTEVEDIKIKDFPRIYLHK